MGSWGGGIILGGGCVFGGRKGGLFYCGYMPLFVAARCQKKKIKIAYKII